MAEDGGMDSILRCRTSCGKFWTPWWVCHEEHTGSYEGIIRMDIGWNTILDVHHMRLHEAVSVCLGRIWSVKVAALCGRLFVWLWCYWVWCLYDGLCMCVLCCSCPGRIWLSKLYVIIITNNWPTRSSLFGNRSDHNVYNIHALVYIVYVEWVLC